MRWGFRLSFRKRVFRTQFSYRRFEQGHTMNEPKRDDERDSAHADEAYHQDYEELRHRSPAGRETDGTPWGGIVSW